LVCEKHSDASTLGSSPVGVLQPGNQWQLALVFFDDMTSVAKLRPDVINFNAAISACEKQGRWQEAWAAWAVWGSPNLWALVTRRMAY